MQPRTNNSKKLTSKKREKRFEGHKRRPKSSKYVVLNIKFGNMDTTRVLEKQSFTLTDFVLYVANIFNLFVGMSFVSFAEVFVQVVMRILQSN